MNAREAPAAPAVAAVVVAAFLISFGALHYGFFTRNALMDTPLYERYGDAIVHRGEVPYRDFAVEYPPGALPVFAAPSALSPAHRFPRYARLFETLMLLCGAAASALVAFVLTRQCAGTVRLVGGTLLAGLAPLALGPVVLSRFDLWPAALTIAGLAAVAAGRPRVGLAVLGAAVAAKVYPAVVLPPALAFVWRRHGRAVALQAVGASVGVVALVLLPFLVLAPGGVWASVHGQASRPLQIETLGAAFLLAAHHAFGLRLEEVASHGSDNLVGGAADVLATLQGLLMPLAVIGTWIAAARARAERDELLRWSAAAVCAFVALGKVLSPQYLIWLIALVPLVRGRRGAVAAGLFVAAMLLTQAWFPYRYIDLVYHLDARASWLVLARDLVLAALLLTLVWPARAWRWGTGVVAVLGAAALAAAGAAVAVGGTGGAQVPTHARVLVERGVPSSCASAPHAPTTTAGTVAYDVASFRNPTRRSTCVTATLRAPARAQVFAAAYTPRFDARDVRARYAGDAGACTSIAPGVGATVTFGFRVAARAPFAVEVERCDAVGGAIPYRLELRSRGARVAFATASASRVEGAVTLRWRTRGGAVFRVVRDGDEVARVRAHRFVDDHAPIGARYWIGTSTNAEWAWYGPLVPDA